MAQQKSPSIRRGEMAFMAAIILGLILGVLVKRVKLGVILGLIIGIAIVFLGWTRAKRR